MIQITDVSKTLGRFQLHDINLTIPDGYITGVIGRNGAGKTSLFHLILGLYKADSGTITVNGMDYMSQEAAIREEIGVVLQERLYEEYESLIGNAKFYGRYFKNYDGTYMKELLAEFELNPDQKYGTISKGEELKFQFAFALAHHPKLLLLDEPTGNFDPNFRELFWKHLSDFVADGEHAVLMATHLTDDLDRMADYIIYMEDGGVLLQSDIEEIREEYRIIQGDAYKVKLFRKDYVIAMEENEIGAKALVRHKKRFSYEGLLVATPTIEDLMYFMSKKTEQDKKEKRRGGWR